MGMMLAQFKNDLTIFYPPRSKHLNIFFFNFGIVTENEQFRKPFFFIKNDKRLLQNKNHMLQFDKKANFTV